MCKACGWKIEKGITYSTNQIMELPDGKEQMIKIAQSHFIGEKVLIVYKGFCGTANVTAIERSDVEVFLFMIVDKNGCKYHFSEGFNFEILIE